MTEEMLPAQTTVGPVSLTVADLERSLDYYGSAIGLALRSREGGTATLGAGETELLQLVEEPDARPRPGTTGLYHFALLVPNRAALGAWLAHAVRDRVPLTGASDHYVSEALYLRDPDGHGIEIYADRARELWEGRVATTMTTLPLDAEDLLAAGAELEGSGGGGVPAGTVMGHVHLKVADVASTVTFYRDVAGFDLTASFGAQAAFLSAGGYHHRIGANTWESAGAPPPPPGSASLRHATIVLPDAAARDALADRVEDAGGDVGLLDGEPLVADPSGNRLLLAAGR